MSEAVTLEDLRQVPHFDPSDWQPNREIVCLSFYVKGEWEAWMPWTPDRRLQKVKMWPAESDYFGDHPERETDQSFPLFHLLAQRSSYPELYKLSRGIWNDYQNLAASLGKLQLFFEASKSGQNVTRYATTELEYVVYVCRGIFDLLQEIIAAHLKRIRFHDAGLKRRELPKSFADVIYKSNVRQTAEQIAGRYGLPIVLGQWYASTADLFEKLRYLRNVMTHGGSNAVEILFTTERGFGIFRSEKHWSDFYDWPVEVELKNRIVPLRPVVCAIVWSVIATCNSFAQLLESRVQLPKELFPGLRFFSRGYHDKHLSEVETVLRHSLWCDTDAGSFKPGIGDAGS